MTSGLHKSAPGPDPTAGAASEGKACPICGKPSIATYRPFCSARCSDVDLNRWLGGVYAVPASEAGDDEDDRADGSSETPGR